MSIRWAIPLLILPSLVACFRANTECSIGCEHPPSQLIWPPPGDTDVPIDTAIWFQNPTDPDGSQAELSLAAGSTSVDGTQRTLETLDSGRFSHQKLLAFFPAAPLQPHTSYLASLNGIPAGGFTTGEGETRPPTIPTVMPTGFEIIDEPCVSGVSLHEALSYTGLFVVVQFADEQDQFDATTASGAVSQLTLGTTFDFDTTLCMHTWDGAPKHARFGTVNAAGVFSGWSTPQTVSRSAAACASGDLPGLLGFGVALGLARWRLRRKRSA